MTGWFGQERTPLKRTSSKTAARDRRYRAERAMFLDSHGTCEANLPHTCDTEQIYEHIKANKGSDSISREDCIRAIKMIQEAVRRDVAGGVE